MRRSRRCGPSPIRARMSASASGATWRPLGVARPRRRPRRFAGTDPVPRPGTPPDSPERPEAAISAAPRSLRRTRVERNRVGPLPYGSSPVSSSCLLRLALAATPRAQSRPCEPSQGPAPEPDRSRLPAGRRQSYRPVHGDAMARIRGTPRVPDFTLRRASGRAARDSAGPPAGMVIESGVRVSPRNGTSSEDRQPGPCPSISADSTSAVPSPTA